MSSVNEQLIRYGKSILKLENIVKELYGDQSSDSWSQLVEYALTRGTGNSSTNQDSPVSVSIRDLPKERAICSPQIHNVSKDPPVSVSGRMPYADRSGYCERCGDKLKTDLPNLMCFACRLY